MIRGLRRSEQAGVRLSDADRELAAERLRDGLADGRLTIPEFEKRYEAVLAAVYASDLGQPLAELPGGDLVILPPTGRSDGKPTVLRVGAAGLRRTGRWSVPARLEVKGGMGSVLLDFCRAEICHPVVQIELKLGTGSVELILPDAATADVDALVATMGSVRSKVAPKRSARAPHFVVCGHTRMGSITVRRRHFAAGLRR